MAEESVSPRPLVGAYGGSRIGGGFTSNMPRILAVLAFAGALVPLHAASAAESTVSGPAADTRAMADPQPLVDPGIVFPDVPVSPSPNREGKPQPETPSDVGSKSAPAIASEATAEAGSAAPVATSAPSQVSAADRLRGDPSETAPVPPETSVKPNPPVKLTKDEQAVAVHITRSFRVERGSIERIVHHAYQAAREVRLDPHLLLAVMAVESGFDANASSNAGAKGLMQVHVKVHRNRFERFGGADAVYDPPANIKVGAGILSEYVTRYGDVAAGLKAYVGAALLPSDRGYGSKVLNRQAEFDAVLRSERSPAREARTRAPADAGPSQASGSAASAKAGASNRDASTDGLSTDESM